MMAGLHPCSFIDFPGELSAVIFTQGCDLRCRYCHNPELCSMTGAGRPETNEVLRFLEKRRNKLTAVTITGGEPTLHASLPALLSAVRALEFKTKLDTNGMRPGIIRDLIRGGLLDYAAVDVKVAPGLDGSRLTGAADQGERAMATLRLLVANNLPHEARTTVIRGVHDETHLSHIGRCLAAAGVTTWRIQPVQAGASLDPDICLEAPSDATLARVVEASLRRGLDAAVRRGPMGSEEGKGLYSHGGNRL